MGYMRFRMCKLIIRREGSCQFNRFALRNAAKGALETKRAPERRPLIKEVYFLSDPRGLEN